MAERSTPRRKTTKTTSPARKTTKKTTRSAKTAKPASATKSAAKASVKKTVKKAEKPAKAAVKVSTANKVSVKLMALYAVWIIGGVLVVASAIAWYFMVYMSPGRIFWDMVDNSLATPGITRTKVQTDATTRITDEIQLTFGSPTTVMIHEVAKQQASEQGGAASAVVEKIGTNKDDYQRFLEVHQASTGGQPLDYKPIYGQWVHTNSAAAGQSSDKPSVLQSAVFSPVLAGNIPPQERKAIIGQLKKRSYKVDAQTARSATVNGHSVYQYNVKVNLKDFAPSLKIYAKALGLAGAEDISPDSYQASDQLEFMASVDKRTRQLVRVNFKNTNMVEDYSAYGLFKPAPIPAKSLNTQQFQEKIKQITGNNQG